MAAGIPLLSENLGRTWWLTYAAWVVALAATLASLYLGEVKGLPPCLLCWYQRIAMFPLALILALGLARRDLGVIRYALPLALGGLAIAVFHQGLVAGWVPRALEPCARGVPCSKTLVEWFGFITVPGLSITAFALISLLLVLAARAR